MSLILQLHCSRSLPYGGPHVNIYGTDTDSNNSTTLLFSREDASYMSCRGGRADNIADIAAIPVAGE